MTKKKIKYSDHLKYRIKFRSIDVELPEVIINEPEHKFIDTLTGYYIAIKKINYRGKHKLMMVAYEETDFEITAVTIHPLDDFDMEKKIRNGRWI